MTFTFTFPCESEHPAHPAHAYLKVGLEMGVFWTMQHRLPRASEFELEIRYLSRGSG